MPYVGILGFLIIGLQIFIDFGIRLFVEKANKEKPTGMNAKSKRKMSQYEIERYAAMCNAYLEHEDEMKQYNTKHDN